MLRSIRGLKESSYSVSAYEGLKSESVLFNLGVKIQ